MTLHRRRASPVAFADPSTPRENHHKAAQETEIQQHMRFQNVYPSMVTTGGIQTAVVCAGSLSVRSCKLLWKPALFQLVATTTAPSHANTIDVADDEDSEEEESKEADEDKKDKGKMDGGKRGSLRYSLVFFQRGLLGRTRRKRVDLSDGSARFNWSKDGRLLSTRFEFSIDYFTASGSSDRAVAKTLTCRASNATDYLEWTSALRAATEYAAEQWRLQSLSRLTLGSDKPTEIPVAEPLTSPIQRQRLSIVASEPSLSATKQPKKQPQPAPASPTTSEKLERQVTKSRRTSISNRRIPKSSSSTTKKSTALKQLPPFRELRRGSSAKPVSSSTASNCNSSSAIPASAAQSKKLAMVPPPMHPPTFNVSNNSSRCFLTTSNSFADTKLAGAQVFNSNRSLASSFVSSSRSRRRLRTPRSGLAVFSSRRRSSLRRRRRGSAVKPASMAKMVRLRAVDSPFSTSAVELSNKKPPRPAKRPQSEMQEPSNPLFQPLASFHPYHSAAQPRQRTNITRRRVRAESNALDALLLVSQRSSSSEDSCNGTRRKLASSSASVSGARRMCPPSPAPSLHEYLASAHRPLIQSSSGHIAAIPPVASVAAAAIADDVDASDESLPFTRSTEYIDYLVLMAELRAQTQGEQPSSQREARTRARSSAPAVLTREDSLFLTARSALDLEAGDFSDSDEDKADEGSEVDDDSRRQAWRAYLSSFETEL